MENNLLSTADIFAISGLIVLVVGIILVFTGFSKWIIAKIIARPNRKMNLSLNSVNDSEPESVHIEAKPNV